MTAQKPADSLADPELDAILEAVRVGGWYDANPDQRESDYLDTDVAKERLLAWKQRAVVAAQIKRLDNFLLAWSGDMGFEAKDSMRFQLAELRAQLTVQPDKPHGASGVPQ